MVQKNIPCTDLTTDTIVVAKRFMWKYQQYFAIIYVSNELNQEYYCYHFHTTYVSKHSACYALC